MPSTRRHSTTRHLPFGTSTFGSIDSTLIPNRQIRMAAKILILSISDRRNHETAIVFTLIDADHTFRRLKPRARDLGVPFDGAPGAWRRATPT